MNLYDKHTSRARITLVKFLLNLSSMTSISHRVQKFSKMAAKAITEATGKDLINRKLAHGTKAAKCQFVTITETTKWDDIEVDNPWLLRKRLVVKPDQLIKRRGKLGLIRVNVDLDSARNWIAQNMNRDQQVGNTTGTLRNFIIEPFVPHSPVSKVKVLIYSTLIIYAPL